MSPKAKLMEEVITMAETTVVTEEPKRNTRAKLKYCEGCKREVNVTHIHVDIPRPMHPKAVAQMVREFTEAQPRHERDIKFLNTLAEVVEQYTPAWENYERTERTRNRSLRAGEAKR